MNFGAPRYNPLHMNSKLLRNSLFGLLVLGYVYYCFKYIGQTSFDIDGKTYYVLFDDAMISMRYAYNLAHGLGAVWNPGEHVEGFTNPLWVGIMAIVHLFPIGLNETGLYIQFLGASLLTLNLFLVKGIVEHFTDDLLPMFSAVALTAFYAPLNSYGLLGMEVSLLALMISGVVLLVLKSGQRFNLWIYILLAISTLVRFDMAVPYIVIFAVLFISQKENRKKHLIWGLGLLLLFLGGQTLARYLYYGNLLPNTYYLKVEGWNFKLRILRGLFVLFQFVYYSNWVLMLLPLSIFIFRRDWKVTLLALILAAQIAYSVYVGGDAWENHGGANRYIVIAMPLYFIAFSWSAAEWLKKAAANFKVRSVAEVGWRLTFVIILIFSLFNFNALLGDWKSIQRWSFALKPDYVAGGDKNLQIAIALQRMTVPGASIAVIGAGTIPYLLPDRYAIDFLGKTDPYIAHENVHLSMGIPDIPAMRPGHMKWDYAHSIGDLKPDVITAIWEGTGPEAAPYFKYYVSVSVAPGIQVLFRKDSTKILWDEVYKQ